jgi:hypothetical protein
MTTSLYNIHIFQENDNVNIIFDRYNLVEVLTKLYERMGVVNRLDTKYKVNDKEKSLILSLLGDDINIQCNEFDKEKTTETIFDIIEHVRKVIKLKDSLKTNYTNKALLAAKESDLMRFKTDIEEMVLPYYNLSTNNCNNNKILEKQDDAVEAVCNEGNFCYLINEVKKQIEETISKKSYYILYNTTYEAVLICEKNYKLSQIVNEFNDFKLVREYIDLMENTFNNINEYFTKNMYCTEETLIKKLDAFENLYDISKTCPLEEEKRLILYYVKSNYLISDNMDKRIKVSVLLEEVQKELNIKDNSNLRYRFATILSELGLQKKRYSDGMYVYGIETKAYHRIKEVNDLTFNMTSLVRDRDEELKRISKDKHNNNKNHELYFE